MYRNLDSETSKKLDRALANKIKVKRFVTRQEADAIKAALGKKDEIRKRTKETDRTSSILKRLDRVDIEKLIKHPGHPDQRVHSPTGRAAIAREKKPKKPEGFVGRAARVWRETQAELHTPKTSAFPDGASDDSFAEPLRTRGIKADARLAFYNSPQGKKLRDSTEGLNPSDDGEKIDRAVTSHYRSFRRKRKKRR